MNNTWNTILNYLKTLPKSVVWARSPEYTYLESIGSSNCGTWTNAYMGIVTTSTRLRRVYFFVETYVIKLNLKSQTLIKETRMQKTRPCSRIHMVSVLSLSEKTIITQKELSLFENEYIFKYYVILLLVSSTSAPLEIMTPSLINRREDIWKRPLVNKRYISYGVSHTHVVNYQSADVIGGH